MTQHRHWMWAKYLRVRSQPVAKEPGGRFACFFRYLCGYLYCAIFHDNLGMTSVRRSLMCRFAIATMTCCCLHKFKLKFKPGEWLEVPHRRMRASADNTQGRRLYGALNSFVVLKKIKLIFSLGLRFFFLALRSGYNCYL